MPGGGVIGALFFLLLVFAALTSSISLFESIIAHFEETTGMGRKKITIYAGVVLWLVGLGSVFSFNIWSGFTPLAFIKPLEGKTIFGIIDYFGSNLLMPIGGILMAVIAGWLLSRQSTHEELDLPNENIFMVWRILIRFIAPATVAAIFFYNLY